MPKVKISYEKVKKIVPKKQNEFDLFIHILEGGAVIQLGKIAEVLGVSPETISDWKKDPRAIQAQAKAVSRAFSKMQEVGAEDWRMWDKVLDRAGLVVQSKTDMTTNGKDIVIPIYGGASVQRHDSDQKDI